MNNLVALNSYLNLLQPYFNMPNVTDICINRPQEIWVEKRGQFQRFDVPQLSGDFLWKFAQLVAESNQREISRECPTLSAVLPNGLRSQFVIEPACEQGSFICAIRQKAVMQMELCDYFLKNAHHQDELRQSANQLVYAYEQKDYVQFLKLAVQQKKNIIISGGTSTGKTSLLNTLVQCIPQSERLITTETEREIYCSHPNRVHLLAAEEGRSVANINMLGLLKATLRLRPDRILLPELRAEEAFAYLRAINSGHPGSITTMHADDPMGCFEQLAFMVMQGGSPLSRQEIVAYVKSIIHVIVQIKKIGEGRFISEIYFNGANRNARSKTMMNELIDSVA